jgi:TDG/mug DNA glycosylase family protein
MSRFFLFSHPLKNPYFSISNSASPTSSNAPPRADELTDDELRAGGQCLPAKVNRWRPTIVAFVGIGPYRIVSGIKDARVGLQKAAFGGSHGWVLPNPSGLNAHYQPAALAQLFGDLRLWAIAQHGRQ